jgi:hypothetical protein
MQKNITLPSPFLLLYPQGHLILSLQTPKQSLGSQITPLGN